MLVDDPNRSVFDGSPSDGLALDVVVVSPLNKCDSPHQDDNGEIDTNSTGIIASSDFYVNFPNFQQQLKCCTPSQLEECTPCIVLLEINKTMIDPTFLSMTLSSNSPGHKKTKEKEKTATTAVVTEHKQQCVFNQGRSTKPSTDALQQLVKDGTLHEGKNMIRYVLASYNKSSHNDADTSSIEMQIKEQKQLSYSTTATWTKKYIPIDSITAHIYLWNVRDHVVVIDIDGTVTKSNVRGVISTIVTENYGHVHDGVCAFFSNLANHTEFEKNADKRDDVSSTNTQSMSIAPGDLDTTPTSTSKNKDNNQIEKEEQKEPLGKVRVLYLSSRPIRLMYSTRKFVSQLCQSPPCQYKNSSSKVGMSQYISCLNPSISQDDSDDETYEFCGVGLNINSNEGIYDVGINSDHEIKSEMESSSSQKQQNERKFWKESNDSISRLPEGPLFLHTGTLSTVLVTELVKKSIYKYKADTLMRQVVLPFVAAGKETDQGCAEITIDNTTIGSEKNSLIFLAGFGNQGTDAKAYEIAGIKKEDIFIINKKSELFCTHDDPCDDFEKSTKNNTEAIEQDGKIEKETKTRIFSGYDDPNLITTMLSRIKKVQQCK